MFKKNRNQGQISIADPYLQFPKYVQEALQKTWAPYFYKHIFKSINVILQNKPALPLQIKSA